VNPIDDYQAVLQNIEAVVVNAWRSDPTINNYTVIRAYEAAIAEYGAIARQHTPKPDAVIFEDVRKICEWRLGHTAISGSDEKITPIPIEDLVACLRKLRKSVDHWTRARGRSGYLEYIEEFLP
jgi:hypothetical protein